MEKNKNRNSAMIIAVLLLIMAAAIAVAVIVKIAKSDDKETVEENHNQLKETIHIFQKLPKMIFTDKDGKEVCLNDQMEGISVLIYWASWCPHCVEGLSELDALAEQVEETGVKVFLIDKEDGEKEKKEQALALLEEKGVKKKTLFDKDAKVYEEVGLHMIPTTIVVNSQGVITSMLEGGIPSAKELKIMIEEAKKGKTFTMMETIQSTLVNDLWGMHTNYMESDAALPSGNDVLSESMGILMEYAALSENKEAFEKYWNYVSGRLFEEGLMPWVITEKEETNVNALIDDFRIIHALKIANERFGGYDNEYNRYLEAIYNYQVQKDQLVDFYDVEYKQKASRFTLCYGDLVTLQEIKQEDKRFKQIYSNTLERIKGGQISENFPLYYSYYDYEEQKYVGKDLNMSEAFTTLLHLAEVDELPKEALDWIDKKLQEDCIYAVYDITGESAEDGYYESTAVYALAAMIALEEGREDMAGKAITKMEQFRVKDGDSIVNGAFGNADGTGIYSFDQGMALLAYEKYMGYLDETNHEYIQ